MRRGQFLFLALLPLASAAGAITQPPKCGAVCLAEAILNSTCSPTDMICICTNEELTKTAEACVLTSCSVRDSLSTKNYSMAICQAPVRDDGWSTLWLGMSFFILSFVIFVLRVISRMVSTVGFYLDDYLAIAAIISGLGFACISIPLYKFGLGKDIWTVPFHHITKMLFAYYQGEWVYALAIFFTKMSMLFFYLRIFPSRGFRIQVYCVMGAVAIYSGLGAIVSIFQCTPVRGAWKYWDGEEHFHCRDRNALGWSSAIINMSLDLAIIALPLRPLSKLTISWRKKVQVILMFMVGIFVTIVSIIRLSSLIHFADSTNATWDYRAMGYWSQIEVHVGNVCACMPAIYSLLKKIWPALVGTKQDPSYPPDSGKQRSRSQTDDNKGTEDEADLVQLVDMAGTENGAWVRAGP